MTNFPYQQRQEVYRGYTIAGGEIMEEFYGLDYLGVDWPTHLTRRIKILTTRTTASNKLLRSYTTGKLIRYKAELALCALVQKALAPC